MNDRDCDNCVHHSEGGCSVWECSFERKKDDLISRQAAVDAVCGWCQADCTPCEFFPCGEIKAVQALPPAQQNLQPTCNQLATDTISRQAAIDVIFSEPLYESGMKKRDADAVVPAIYEKIKSLQPAQPEPRWIPCSPETMPKKTDYYLVQYTRKYCRNEMAVAFYSVEEARCDDDYTWEIEVFSDIKEVIAWMPLPKPYEERREE